MLKNTFFAALLATLVGGMILLYMEYGFFEDNQPIVIVQSPVSMQDKSDKPIEIVPSPISEPDEGVIAAKIDTIDTVKSSPLQPAPLDFKINYLYRAGNATTFKPLTTDSVLHSNDAYKLIFTPKADSYVYIFQKDSAQKIYQLFPMESFKGVILNNTNPVQGNQTYYIPAKDKSFVLDEQTGTETLYFLAFRQRNLALEAQYETIQTAQQQDDAVQLKLAEAAFLQTLQDKGLRHVELDQETLTWTEQGRHFSVLQQRLDDLCHECIQVLTFKHE